MSKLTHSTLTPHTLEFLPLRLTAKGRGEKRANQAQVSQSQ
jgi:hypothetical protein